MNIEKSKKFLSSINEFPDEIVISNHEKIVNPKKFFEIHVLMIETCESQRIRETYESRLKKALLILKKQKNAKSRS